MRSLLFRCATLLSVRGQTPLNELYVRTQSQLIADQDIKTYDLGRFQIASQGIPCSGSALSLGELWVTYQIRFLKPRISDYLDSGYARLSHDPAVQPAGSNPFNPNPLTAWVKQSDNIDVTIVDANTFSIPLRSNERTYMCTFTVFDPENDNSQASAVGYFTATSPAFTNASLVQGLAAFNSISSTTVVGGVNTSGSSYIFYFKTDALAPGKVIWQMSFCRMWVLEQA